MAQFSFWESQTFESQITSIPNSYLAANQNFTHSCKKLPGARTVLGVYLRINVDLGPAASAATIRFDDEDARGAFFGALMSQIEIVGAKASLAGFPIVQRMSLQEHYQIVRGLGVIPVAPQLLDQGFGPISRIPRGDGSADSHFVQLVYPIVIGDCGPEFGAAFALGSEQLEGMTFNFNFGSFSFTDSAGTTWTIGGGDAPGNKISAEIVYRYRLLPEGVKVVGNPIRARRIQNTDSERVNLTPGGVTLAHTVRLAGSAGSYTPADSAGNLLRKIVYANGSDLTAPDIYRIEQYLAGEDQPDAWYRRLPDLAYEDMFRTGGLELDQDQFTRASAQGSQTTCPLSSVRYEQGGLRLASLRGDRPMSSVLCGPYDVKVPPQFNAATTPNTYVRTHLVALVQPRAFGGQSLAGSGRGFEFASRNIQDTVSELASVVASSDSDVE